MFRAALIAAIGSLAIGTAHPAFAADQTSADAAAAGTVALSAQAVTAPRVEQPLSWTYTAPVRSERPVALPLLYTSLAAAQVFDAYSTRQGLASGAREANPLMRGEGAAFWTMKAVGTAVPIIIAERMWKKNKAAAIVTMVLANSVMAVVAANNAQVLGRQR